MYNNSQEIIIKEVAKIISKGEVVAFTGAGISAESGIPPFRGSEGLWEKYNPEEYAYIESFITHPEKVWEMLREIYKSFIKAKPNIAHLVLAEMEQKGILKGLITQNIDGLHQKAGSKKVIELHGTGDKLICLKCLSEVEFKEEFIKIFPFPRCNSCGFPLKPKVTFFGEPLSQQALSSAYELVQACKTLLIIGTSGVVVPAAYIPYKAKRSGAIIVEINLEETPYTSSISDYFLKGKAGEILSKLKLHLEALIC